MKKLPAVILIFVMIFSFLTACGNGNNVSTTPPASSNKPETSESASEDLQPETSAPAQEDVPIEMGELAIVIGGDAITLPMTIEDFMALGWEPVSEESGANLEKTLNPKEFTTIYLLKGDKYAKPNVANLSEGEAITVNQGTIVGFDEVSSDEMLELPNGIVQRVSSMEDIIAAYGEPDEVDSWGKWTSYYIEGFVITVWEYEDTGLLGQVQIRFQGWENFDRIVF